MRRELDASTRVKQVKEELKKENETPKLTPEKISETTLKALVQPSNSELKDQLSLNLTDRLPKTLANYAIPSNTAKENFNNILAFSMHQSRNAEEKQKFESIAQANLTTLLNNTNQNSLIATNTEPGINTEEIPTGGRISLDLLSFLNIK